MTFVSIIIPYNKVKRYLKDCLDSLSEQNLKDEEVILVINGISENLDDFLNDYDLNIKKLHFKDEITVSKARNEALKVATGEYVYFIDGDDYIYSNGLEKLISTAKKTNADFINGERINTAFIKSRFTEELEKLDEKKNYPLTQKKLTDEEFSYQLLVGAKTDEFEVLSVLHALIKKEKLDGIYFNETIKFHPDYEFMINALHKFESFVGVEEALYAKRISDDHIHLPSLNQQMKDSFNVYADNYKFAIENIDNDLLKKQMNAKLFNYYYEIFALEFFTSPNNKWRNEYFDTLSGLFKDFNYDKIGWYQKKELNALKAKDKGKLTKLLKLRINFTKVLEMNNWWRIKTAIYYKIFNRKELKQNQILFTSFKGDFYSDSPKCIYEYLYQKYGDKYEYVWVMNNNNVKIPGNPKTVKRYSLKYYKQAAISKYWVINGRQSGILDKRKEQIIVSTWHGTPLKKLGLDIGNVHSRDPLLKESYIRVASQWNYLISPNHYTTEILKSSFGYDKEIYETGYPRNDILYNATTDDVNRIKNDLNIPNDKKIILYAPTWRDDEFIDIGLIKFQLKLDLKRMKEVLGEEYIVLVRTHYFIAGKLDLDDVDDFAIDVSKYNDISELYLISDMLITDYSSVFFDYANLKRPILYYVYDFEKYENVLRGFYIDMHEEVPGPLLKTTDEVIDAIQNIDLINSEYHDKYEEFYNRFCSIEDGNATERIVEKVWGK